MADRTQLNLETRQPDHTHQEDEDQPISAIMRRIWGLFLNNAIRLNSTPPFMEEWIFLSEQIKVPEHSFKASVKTILKPTLSIQKHHRPPEYYKETPASEAKSISDLFFPQIDIASGDFTRHHIGNPFVEALKKETSSDDRLFFFDLAHQVLSELLEFTDWLFAYSYDWRFSHDVENLDNFGTHRNWTSICLVLPKLWRLNTMATVNLP